MRRLGVIVLVILLVVLVGLQLALSHMTPVVKKVMETYGPQVTGAPLTVEKVSFSLLQTRFEMTGLVLGNPPGFKTPSSVEVGRVLVKVRPLSLFTDTIHVQQILVEKPAITYEVGLGESNIGVILKNVDKFAATFEKEEKTKKETSPEEEKAGKKVVIDEVSVSGGQVRLSATILQGNAAPIPLPTVTLHDLGKESDGVSPVAATREVLTKVLGSVTEVGKKALDSLGDGAKKAAEALGDGAKKAGEALEKGMDKLRNLF
ncbi:MAG: AsmA family protein [Oligosphaeraceae bacterium]